MSIDLEDPATVSAYEVFATVAAALGREGEVRLTVPMAYVEAVARSRPARPGVQRATTEECSVLQHAGPETATRPSG